MAKLRDYAVTIETSTSTSSSVLEMPTHVTGDLLLIFFNKDTGSGGPSTPSGWTSLQSQASAGSFGQVFAKRATSSSETVTLSYTAETSISIVVSVKNCYGSTVANAVSNSNVTGADDTTVPLGGGTITPSFNNSLIFSFLSTDTGLGPMTLPGWVNVFGGDAGADSAAVSYTYQKTAASISHPGYWGATQDDSRAFMIVVRDDGNETEVDPYVDVATNPCTQLTPFIGVTTTAALQAANKGTWKTIAPLDITTINGKTYTFLAITTTADSGYNPFRGSAASAGSSSKTVLYGNQMVFGSQQNLTLESGVVFGTLIFTLPRDYLDLGKALTGGVMVGFADPSNNARFWTIGGQFSKTTTADKRMNYAIEVANTDSDYYTTGTAPTLSTIDDFYLASASYYAACAIKFSELWRLNTTVIAGGTAANPLNFLDVIYAINEGSGHLPLMVQQGSAATCWTRIQFGGADPIHASVNLRTFQFPLKADGLDYVDFHVRNNVLGVEFYGKAGDDIEFTNCVFTSDSTYYWRFNASHSGSANLDFSGTSVVNATVTLQSTSDLDGTTFINCPTFTQNGATLTNCTFSNTKVSSSSPANAALISESSFTSSGTGHGVEIGGTAADFTFTGNTFTDYAASDGSTGNEAIYVNIASGTVTINIAGGGSTPSIRTAGATVIVNNAVTLKITVVDSTNSPVENAQTAIYKSSDGTQLMNEDTNASGIATESFNYTSDTDVYIRVRKSSTGETKYYPASTTGTITSSGFTATVTLIEDTTA